MRKKIIRKILVTALEKTFFTTLLIPCILYADSKKNEEVTELETIEVVAPILNKSYPGGIVNRSANSGLLGNVGYMDNPYNVTSYGQDTLQKKQSQNIAELLGKYDASIGGATSDTSAQNFLSVRGFRSETLDTNINGLSGMAGNHKILSNGIDSVQVIKGPSAMLTGASVSGSIGANINLTTKKAENEPITDFGLYYYSRSRAGLNIDLARRFGQNKEWGVRLNSDYRQGNGIRDHQKEKTTLNALSVDFKGENIRIFFDAMLNNITYHGARGFLHNDLSTGAVSIDGELPKAPNGKINFDHAWSKQASKDRMAMSRVEWDILDNITAHAAIGYARTTLASPVKGNWLITKQDNPNAEFGSFRPLNLSDFRSGRNTISSDIGITGQSKLGLTTHRWSIGTSSSLYNDLITSDFYKLEDNCSTSTIYQVNHCDVNTSSTPISSIVNRTRSKLTSVAVSDTISFWDEKFQAVLGIRHQKISNKNKMNGNERVPIHQSANSPSIGLVFKPSEDFSIYGSYIEGLSQGDIAPLDVKNAGEIMDPYKTKQVELGVKKHFGSWLASASIFQIEKNSGGINYDTLIYETNGRQKNKGVELNLFGEPIDGLRLSTSLSIIKRNIKYNEEISNGSYVIPVPKFSSKVNVEWDIPKTDQVTLLGSVNHTGKAIAEGHDFYTGKLTSAHIPAWTRVDLGVIWTTDKLLGKNTILQATVENVFNKRYWTVGDFKDGTTIMDHAAPRTFLFSLKTKF